jgi:ligand-binding sensor domain-containing protein/signal transduction histidine kinase
MKKFPEVDVFYKRIGIIILLLLSVFYSCNYQKNTNHSLLTKRDSIAKPVLLHMLKPPTIALLDTCPPPKITQAHNKLVATSADFYIPMKQYNVEDGLVPGRISCSFCDKKGNLWFGSSDGGASCFNGKSFINYTRENGLVDDQIFSIFQDKDDNFWFGTWNGVTKYDGKTFKRFSNIYTSDPNVPPCCVFHGITEDNNNNIWIGSEGGLSKYNGRTFKNYKTTDGLKNESVYSILQDAKGNVWIGTDSGASKFNGKSFVNFTKSGGLVGNHISALLEDNNGNILFGTGEGLSIYNGHTFKNLTTSQGLISNKITSLLEDRNHHIWIGTNNGVSEYDGISFKNYSKINGLISNNIRSIVKDKDENIWFSTNEDGICKYPGNSFKTLTKAQGLASNEINAIFQDKDGVFWFGSNGDGVIKYDGKSFATFTKEQGLVDNGVLDIYQDRDNNIWIATYNGISCYNGKYFITYTTTQGLPVNTVWSIAQDKDGNMWFGTFGGGLSKLSYDRKSITTFSTHQGLTEDNIHEIIIDKKENIWLCNDNGGITQYNGKDFLNYGKEQGLKESGVLGCWEDRNNNLWFGGSEGFCRFDGKSFLYFSKDDGLPDNIVLDIKEDKQGVIWVGTRMGLSGLKFKPKENNSGEVSVQKFKNGDISVDNNYIKTNYNAVFETFSFKNDYPVKSINYTNSIFFDKDNKLWAGTTDKLVQFDEKEIYKNLAAPVLSIENIKINGEAIPWYDIKTDTSKPDSIIVKPNINEEQNLYDRILTPNQRDSIHRKFHAIEFDGITRFNALPVNLKLPYKNNSIAFAFVAVDPGRPNLVRYQYMLEGYDDSWSDISNSTTASFGNMNEGEYIFKLKALSSDGVWSPVLQYSFEVLPPWYRTWWAYIAYIIFAAFLMQRAIRWRIRKLNKEKALLEEKINFRTHQLKEEKQKVEATLSELKSTQAQLIQSEKMASLGELTAGIAHEIQNPLNFVNNFSEVNKELVDELENELKNNNNEEAILIAKDIKDNEEKILHHGKRADAIVKGMLQHSRISTGQKGPTDINALADEYLRLSYHGLRAKDKTFNATLQTDFDTTIDKINIVPQDIGRVLLNLFNNAFYAVIEKKKMQNENYEPTVSVCTKKIDDKIEIRVADNGNGIPPKVVDKIFQPFFTTKPTGQGTGLGLSLSYDIIKAHGGEIKVETKEVEGSEFIIQLPITV